MARLRPRTRLGRCYELSWKYQCDDDRFVGWLLVHGEGNSKAGERIGHAWLEFGDCVFDPVENATYEKTAYYARYGAKCLHTYEPKEAALAATAHGHFGPYGA
jgi:hypothetical protein